MQAPNSHPPTRPARCALGPTPKGVKGQRGKGWKGKERQGKARWEALGKNEKTSSGEGWKGKERQSDIVPAASRIFARQKRRAKITSSPSENRNFSITQTLRSRLNQPWEAAGASIPSQAGGWPLDDTLKRHEPPKAPKRLLPFQPSPRWPFTPLGVAEGGGGLVLRQCQTAPTGALDVCA